jgi:predicted DNA-binding protein (MmcQ/YjbR family)
LCNGHNWVACVLFYTMDIEQLRSYCLAKPGVEETLPFGPDVLVFKVMGKLFLLCPLDTEDFRFNVKCTPELALELRERYSDVLPGYHMNKQHWNTVLVNGSIPAKLLKEWIDLSYRLVADSLPKKLREQLNNGQ